MEITSVKVKKNNNNDGRALGIASIQLDNCLVIHDIKIVINKGKRELCFPSKEVRRNAFKNGEYLEEYKYLNLVHPSNQEFRQYLEDEIFKVYDLEINM